MRGTVCTFPPSIAMSSASPMRDQRARPQTQRPIPIDLYTVKRTETCSYPPGASQILKPNLHRTFAHSCSQAKRTSTKVCLPNPSPGCSITAFWLFFLFHFTLGDDSRAGRVQFFLSFCSFHVSCSCWYHS